MILNGVYSNRNASTNTVIINWKTGGVYYKLTTSASFTVATNTATTNTVQGSIILEAGESLSVNTSLVGLNASSSIIEFDSTSNVRMVRATSIVSGDNTIYTCPAGKSALIVPYGGEPFYAGGATSGSLSIVSSSGLTPNLTWYMIPNGGSKGNNNIIKLLTATNASFRNYVSYFSQMNAGDSIVMNTSATLANTQVLLIVCEV